MRWCWYRANERGRVSVGGEIREGMENRTKDLEKGWGRGGEGMEYRTKDLEKGRGGEGWGWSTGLKI